MTEYHVNPVSDQAVICKEKDCPHPGIASKHFTTPSEAKEAYDTELVETYLSNAPSGLTEELFRTAPELPPLVVTILGEYLTDKAFSVKAIVPSGSTLYNTELPGRERHDYDYVVFVDDDERLPRYKHALIGYQDVLVDFFIVPLSMVETYVRQGQIVEAYFAVLAGLSLYKSDSFTRLSDEDSFLSSYFVNLEEYIGKHAAGDYPPARLQRERKHMLRWRIYVTRQPKKPFSPRLSESERKLWLSEF